MTSGAAAQLCDCSIRMPWPRSALLIRTGLLWEVTTRYVCPVPNPSYSHPVIDTGQLQMYDVRYPVNGLQRNPNPVKGHHTSTTPYLSFSDYSPTVIPDFDLSSELGLLASGKQNPHPFISVCVLSS